MSSYNTASVKIGDIMVKVGSHYFHPLDIDVFLANMAKAKIKLGWVPKITVEQICLEMVANDLDSFKSHDLLKQYGRKHSFRYNSL
jgi:GDPmannose 4,6-dehydratase